MSREKRGRFNNPLDVVLLYNFVAVIWISFNKRKAEISMKITACQAAWVMTLLQFLWLRQKKGGEQLLEAAILDKCHSFSAVNWGCDFTQNFEIAKNIFGLTVGDAASIWARLSSSAQLGASGLTLPCTNFTLLLNWLQEHPSDVRSTGDIPASDAATAATSASGVVAI
jgi:hypothetical protein